MKSIHFNSITMIIVLVIFGAVGCYSNQYQQYSLPAKISAPPKSVAVFRVAGDPEFTVYGNGELANTRFIPCSTFKIISTLMGLDTGAIAGRDAKLGYDGAHHEIVAWNADVTLEEAFKASCVWYYKKLLGKLDREYVQSTLEHLNYGNCDISVWNSNGHNVFWIESTLLISPIEQVKVIEKIFSGQSGFDPEHVKLLKECMYAGRVEDFFLYGKTGTGRNHNTNQLEAWFVGFAEKTNGDVIYFAMHAADPRANVASPNVREIIREMLKIEFN